MIYDQTEIELTLEKNPGFFGHNFSLVRVRLLMRVFGSLRIEKKLNFLGFKGLKWSK